MTEPDDLRDAFLGRAGSGPPDPSGVLTSLQPRLTRARRAHRAKVIGFVVAPVMVLGGFLSTIETGSDSGQSVVTDDGGVAVETARPSPTPLPSPSPTSAASPSPTPVVTGETSDDVAVPTAVMQPERGSADATAPPAPTSPPLVPAPSPESAASPTPAAFPQEPPSAPAPSATPVFPPTSTAAPTVTPAPTASPAPVFTEVINTDGGQVTVDYNENQIFRVTPNASPGFSSEIEKQEPTEAKVVFSREVPETDIEVEIHLESGELTYDVSPDDD